MSVLTRYRSYILGISAGTIYGIFIRVVFIARSHVGENVLGAHSRFFPTDLWVMTTGFLVLVPVAMGWITISSVPPDGEFHWAQWIFLPWTAVLVANLILLALNIEGFICVVFAVPITLVCGSIGGISAGLSGRAKRLRGPSTMACLALIPILLSAAEMHVDAALEVRTVETSILIHAPVETVWNNIKRVPAIRPSEIRPNWTHRIGFPLPVEATLDREAVGGVRHATFEGGLLFIETVTRWEPGQSIAFTIAADTEHIPPGTLDDHVTIGGRYFDVLNGEYRLEPLADGSILLHLSSHERLSTDFNAYASLWSDAVMRNLQQSILEVVKHRCEAVGVPASANLNP